MSKIDQSEYSALQARVDYLEGALAYALGAIAALHSRRPDAKRLLDEFADHGHYAAAEIFRHHRRSEDDEDSKQIMEGFATARCYVQDPKRLERLGG